MKGRSRSILLLLAATLLIACGSGCDRYARHKVLTFFFTGVPPIDEMKKAPDKEREAGEKAAEEKKRSKKRPPVKATRFFHGPYAANACYLCHEIQETAGSRGLAKEAIPAGSVAKSGVVSGMLVTPLRELCIRCHETKSPEMARRNGLRVHGPVGAGYCTACHGPHNGPEPYLLLEKANESCLGCHADGFVFSKALHDGKKECLSCHNAHVGRTSRLLKAEYQEAW
ncbi:MAG TPA: hypothetical protein DD658_05435 [Deltaproteobacteria bacterium]|nr:hypothetical protein [Deltaproteobacteria bacterium]